MSPSQLSSHHIITLLIGITRTARRRALRLAGRGGDDGILHDINELPVPVPVRSNLCEVRTAAPAPARAENCSIPVSDSNNTFSGLTVLLSEGVRCGREGEGLEKMPRSRAAHLLAFFRTPSQTDHRLVLRVVFLTALVRDFWGAPQIAPKTRLQQPAVQVDRYAIQIPLLRVQLPIADSKLDSAMDAISFSSPERLSAVFPTASYGLENTE